MPASEPKKLAGIFISYRRSDTPDAVGRIYDRLVSEFGKARVFKDVDSIPLGQDFRGHLNDIVGNCAAVLAIIGPKWMDIRNEAGQKRLDDPDDFVRIELEAALARSVPVVPVLVGHAPTPGATQLPASLGSLAFRQSIEVRPDPDFHNDATRLVSALWAIVDPDATQPRRSTGENAGVNAPAKVADGRRFAWLVAAAGILAAAVLAFPALRHLRERPPPEMRIAIEAPVADNAYSFALSPDGRQIVYVAKGASTSRLWLRSLSSTVAQSLPGTEGGVAPFWSPDGRAIAFFASGSLKRFDLGSSVPKILASAGGAENGAWGEQGDILFNHGNGPLIRIAASGGPVTELSGLVPNPLIQRVLAFLPGGRTFLFMSVTVKERGIYLGALDGSAAVRLTPDVGPGTYLPSGWMLWLPINVDATQASPTDVVVAQRLDVRNAKLTGAPVTITGVANVPSVSHSGLIAYRTDQAVGQRQLTWMNRSGAVLGTIGDADNTLSAPSIAPDGRRVVVSRAVRGNRDIWLLDGERASRMTLDNSSDDYPVWSPDGLRVTFASSRSGFFWVYEKLASGAGGEELLKTGDGAGYPSGWSKDGRYLLYFSLNAKNNVLEIGVLPKAGDQKPYTFLGSSFNLLWAQFSPDGRWVAYQSEESGRYEVYVRPFSHTDTAGADSGSLAAAQGLVSTSGGASPLWSANGKELFYVNPSGEMMAVPISVAGASLVPGTPKKLFDTRIFGGGMDNGTGRQYDVAPDGRFLVNRELDTDPTAAITLIQNWNPDAGK